MVRCFICGKEIKDKPKICFYRHVGFSIVQRTKFLGFGKEQIQIPKWEVELCVCWDCFLEYLKWAFNKYKNEVTK